jgi:hypothetical protein
MTTKWISQIFSGGAESTPQASPAPAANPPATPAATQPPAQSAPVAAPAGAVPPAAADSSAQETDYDISKVDLNKYVVILLHGKNSFGDKIYSYLKISLGGIEKLKAALLVGMPFNPTDFGSIIAAGRGEPSDEVRNEIASTYFVLTANAEEAPKAVAVTEKKGWDEY